LIALVVVLKLFLTTDTTKFIYFKQAQHRIAHTTGYMRELENFSSGAICLVLASDVFMEEDYIRDFDEFMDSKDEATLLGSQIIIWSRKNTCYKNELTYREVEL
jgi:hypothetical protein